MPNDHRNGPESGPPRVSVIVIFLDAGDFLAEAIESVRAQSLTSWESCSSTTVRCDASTATARRYADEEPWRISYFEHPEHANRGMSASRNLGIRHARAGLLSFLDADDALHPTALEEQAALLTALPDVGLVYGALEYWYSWTGAAADRSRDFVHALRVPPETRFDPPELLTLFLQNRAFVPSGVLVRRGVVEEVGGFEESFRDLFEDQAFAAKVCLASPVYVSGRCWYRYRQHQDSYCLRAKREGRYTPAREPFLRWLAGYLEARGLRGTDVWRTARAELERARAARPGRLARVRRILVLGRRGGGR